MDWIAIITAAAGLATAFGFILLAWQLVLTQRALQMQTKALSVQAYISVTLEFLETMSRFEEHINCPDTKESELSPQERRAIDRYFYFSNMEFMLAKQKTIDPRMANQWLRGIKSSTKKRAIVERWRSTCCHFTLLDEFREFYEHAISETQKTQSDSDEKNGRPMCCRVKGLNLKKSFQSEKS